MGVATVKSKHDHGLSILDTGTREFSTAVIRIARGELWPDTEVGLRQSHRTLRSAMNWLEDTPDFERAHWLLDAAGRLARQTFFGGCEIVFEDGTYYQRCPVALAHNR